MSRDHEDLEQNDDSLNQIEVSHGSISNQTSMYASSSITQSSCTFCCDVINLMLFFASTIFVMLFCYDHVPRVSPYFQGHHQQKIIVMAISILFTVLILIVFVIRCVRRSRYSICQQTVDTIWYKRKRRIPTDASILYDEVDIPYPDAIPHSPSRSSSENINVKLNELSEMELRAIKRILISFTNYHDQNDWCFSPSSQANLSRKGIGLGSSPIQSMNHVKVKFTVKIVLLGSPNVGKTSIFHRILYDRFTEYYMATLGADLGHNTLHIFPAEHNNHLMINLQLWDIAGSEKFSELSRIVYKDSTSFIVVCDVTNPYCSALALPWIREVRSLVYEPHISLLYNKIDLNQKMPTQDNIVEELSTHESYSVSAKTGERVLENFVEVITRSCLHEVSKLL